MNRSLVVDPVHYADTHQLLVGCQPFPTKPTQAALGGLWSNRAIEHDFRYRSLSGNEILLCPNDTVGHIRFAEQREFNFEREDFAAANVNEAVFSPYDFELTVSILLDEIPSTVPVIVFQTFAGAVQVAQNPCAATQPEFALDDSVVRIGIIDFNKKTVETPAAHADGTGFTGSKLLL